jgi:AraC-like DNA-binding protein
MAAIAFVWQKLLMPASGHYPHIGFHRPHRPWHIEAHAHPHYQMVGIMDGMEHVRLGEDRLMLEEGEVILFRPGMAHEEWTDPRRPLASYFMDFVWESPPADLPLTVRDDTGRIRLLMGWMHEEQRALAPQAPALRRQLAELLASLFCRAAAAAVDSIVEATRAYIRAHIAEALTLERLAAQAGLSKYHFLRRYRQKTGRTPMQDVRDLRLEVARNLILTTNEPLKVIAPQAGLGDEYHMSRTFRRYLGMPPGQLRRGAGAASGPA